MMIAMKYSWEQRVARAQQLAATAEHARPLLTIWRAPARAAARRG
jgi:hypothetical protein